MGLRKSRYRFILLATIIAVLLGGCAKEEPQNQKRVMQNGAEVREEMPEETGTVTAVSDGETAEKEALEQFGEYLESLLQERNLKELEQYKISRTLTWKEAADMADDSTALKHFGAYGQYRFSSDGVALLEADVNGDGRKDIIEYLPGVWEYTVPSISNISRLTVYASDAGGDYRVLYFSPDFSTGLGCDDDIYMIEYGGNIYLIFYFFPDSSGITAYQMQDGIPTGMIRIEFERADVDYEVTYCKSGMEESAEKLWENAAEYYPVYAASSKERFMGSAEECIGMETKEYGILEELGDGEEEEYKNRYQEFLGTDRMVFSVPTHLSDLTVYQSDLDNDGEPELYAMDSDYLGIGVFRYDSNSVYIYPTGELYGNGRHEGDWGLQYVMADGMQLTDFEQLCGLDIWGADYVPQIFWVERCGEENITFIKYFAGDYLDCLIEGYCIKDGGYEKVLSVEYHPVITTSVVYEWPEEGEETLTYTVHLLENEDVRYPVPVIYGLPDANLQDEINAEMERLLYDEIEKFHLWDEERPVWVSGGRLTTRSAGNEKLDLICRIIHEYEGYGGGLVHEKENFYLDIDLISGEVELRRAED